MNFLKTNAAHLVWIVAIAVALLGFHSWLAEHDARLASDAAVKVAQVQVTTLEAQQAQTAKAATVQVVTLQRQAAAVKTTAQAVVALPTVEDAAEPLHVEALPAVGAAPLADAADKVAVDALPLFQELNTCKQSAVQVAACTTELSLQKDIDTQKDAEVKALKAKPSFWHRVKDTAITVGIGAAIGYAAAHR